MCNTDPTKIRWWTRKLAKWKRSDYFIIDILMILWPSYAKLQRWHPFVMVLVLFNMQLSMKHFVDWCLSAVLFLYFCIYIRKSENSRMRAIKIEISTIFMNLSKDWIYIFFDNRVVMSFNFFRIKTMSGSFLHPVVCRGAHVLFTLCVLGCV